MATKLGFDHYGEYVEETAYGTTPVNPAFSWIGLIQNIEPSWSMNNKYFRTLRGQAATESRGLVDIQPGLLETSLALEFFQQTDGGAFTSIAFPGLGTGSASGVANTVKDFSLNVSDGTLDYVGLGCMIDSMTCEVAIGEPVTWSMDIVAKEISTTGVTMGAGSHATEIVTAPSMWDDCTVDIGGARSNISAFGFEMSNNLKRLHNVTATQKLYELVPKGRDFTGSVTVNMDAQTDLTIMLASTAQTITFVVGSDTWAFSNCKWDDLSIAFTPEDEVSYTIPFTAESVAIT